MSELITLSKLSALVSENTGIELNVCTAFIRNLSQTVACGLAEGEHVRIKNFGLFEARKAQDGNYDVEFVPESEFAERVNAPFASLRPTVTRKIASQNPAESPSQNYAYAPVPGQTPYPPQQTEAPRQTAFPPVPEQTAYPPQQTEAPRQTAFSPEPGQTAYPPQQTETPQQTAFTPVPGQTPYPPQQPEAPQQTAFPPIYGQAAFPPQQTENPQQTAFPPIYGQTSYTPQQTENPQQTAFPPVTGQTAYPPQQPSTVLPDELYNAPVEPAMTQQQPQETPAYLSFPGIDPSLPKNNDVTVTTTISSDPYEHQSTRGIQRQLPQLSTNKKYVLIGVLGLIAGFILGYLSGRNTSPSEQQDPANIEKQAEKDTSTKDFSSEDVVREYDYQSSTSVADVDPDMEEEEAAPTTEAKQPNPEPETITVKLQKGQRLSDIAQKYYGKKEYWVYIYLENQKSIANPGTIREGTTLRVPPKEKYAPTTDEASNLQWAKSKGAEINNKYIN